MHVFNVVYLSELGLQNCPGALSAKRSRLVTIAIPTIQQACNTQHCQLAITCSEPNQPSQAEVSPLQGKRARLAHALPTIRLLQPLCAQHLEADPTNLLLSHPFCWCTHHISPKTNATSETQPRFIKLLQQRISLQNRSCDQSTSYCHIITYTNSVSLPKFQKYHHKSHLKFWWN